MTYLDGADAFDGGGGNNGLIDGGGSVTSSITYASHAQASHFGGGGVQQEGSLTSVSALAALTSVAENEGDGEEA